ncbi:Tuberculostearic acid methyltransferase UfaA1 [Sinobacterium norvegicum]|uniref:Tuberculostearic acid methyltransferase UfaA1 n=1 Tax=Sinobacterium norvegicum TaxID=1641715 RepID=A0ABM9ADF4_9GAMM|nr:cyclopropane-fatty-acyl-phospholipid synthase family protein [Sinobacterium norvegicum]CAH0991230.1 Tuberculostearic acid methyltransferase UfaA1 [Sinobacterium norvegicum]
MASISTAYNHLDDHLKSSAIDDFAYRKVIKHFACIRHGRLVISFDDQTHSMGQAHKDTDLVAYIHVENKALFRHIMLNGMTGAAEMYMLGAWKCPDLLKLIQLMCRNIHLLSEMDNKRSTLSKVSNKLMHYFNQNTVSGSQRNISAHYDLSNDFFATFLDKSMMYSSAIFADDNTSLEQAATFKLDVICQKLNLSATDHVVEIGTGWGGMAIYAAQHYGCKVTTTTISQQQYDYTCAQVKKLGLEGQITVLMKDYRELQGQFDKLISIEMIEAVGHKFYQSYFEQCSHLLKEDGLALIQAITISDQRFHQAKNRVDFIQRYIFPGGCLPSVSVISNCIADHTDMQIVDLDDITKDYALTLHHWRQEFHRGIEQVKQLGFDDIFCRMWEYYLSYCEGGFRERVIQTSQILIAKPLHRGNTSRRR